MKIHWEDIVGWVSMAILILLLSIPGFIVLYPLVKKGLEEFVR